jgi:L-threonylcarbamoyladenylate synthase
VVNLERGRSKQVSEPSRSLCDQVNAAISIVKGGGVVAIPTDTLYGFAAPALDDAAVNRVFLLKGRPSGMALPLLVADAAEISKWAADIPDVAWTLVQRFWPGALTIVLKRSAIVPDSVCGGADTVGLRLPDCWIPQSICRALGEPITGTSANRTGQPGITTPGAVSDEFGNEVDMIVDGGEAAGGPPSTVLSLAGAELRILRQGAVSRRDIEDACGRKAAT